MAEVLARNEYVSRVIRTGLVTGRVHLQPAQNDNCLSIQGLNQYYTTYCVAEYLYQVLGQLIDLARYLLVEPSAGMGAFFRLMQIGSIGIDLAPKFPGTKTANFLETELPRERKIAVIGNPPFGRNARMAIRFFNHAAWQADVIAMILPRAFRKPAIVSKLNPAFHLIHDEDVPAEAFEFGGAPYSVPAIFQIWERRPAPRWQKPARARHSDFEFTPPNRAQFAIRRIGVRAGRVDRDLTLNKNSHYFVRVNDPNRVDEVEAIFKQLDFGSVACNASGAPSLAQTEIVSLYQQWLNDYGA